MRFSCEGLNLSQGDLVEIYNGMFTYQASIRLLSLILIISLNGVQLWRSELKHSWFDWDIQWNVEISSLYSVASPYFDHLSKWGWVGKVWIQVKLIWMNYTMECSDIKVVVLLPNIWIILASEVELWRFELKSSWLGWDIQWIVQISSYYRVVAPHFDTSSQQVKLSYEG